MVGKKTIPNWASQYLNDKMLADIEAKVAEVEQHTMAEIVPVIVRTSISINAVKSFLILLLLALVGIIIEICFNLFWMNPFERIALALTLLFAMAFLYSMLIRTQWPLRLLTSEAYKEEECLKRAKLEFYENRLQDAKSRSGMIFFVSLLDRKAVIWMDPSIAHLQSADAWKKCVEDILEGAKQKNLGLGFTKAIERAQITLQQHLPVNAENTNELANHLVIKD